MGLGLQVQELATVGLAGMLTSLGLQMSQIYRHRHSENAGVQLVSTSNRVGLRAINWTILASELLGVTLMLATNRASAIFDYSSAIGIIFLIALVLTTVSAAEITVSYSKAVPMSTNLVWEQLSIAISGFATVALSILELREGALAGTVNAATISTILIGLGAAIIAIRVGTEALQTRRPSTKFLSLLGTLGLLSLTGSVAATSTSFALGASTSNTISSVSIAGSRSRTAKADSISNTSVNGLTTYTLDFNAQETVSKPNFHQIVQVHFAGTLDKGQSGSVSIYVAGVPQPDGTILLSRSIAHVRLRGMNTLGLGNVDLFNARAIRGSVTFGGRRKYEYVVSYSPTSATSVAGEVNLFPTPSSNFANSSQPL